MMTLSLHKIFEFCKDEKGNDHGVDNPNFVEICIGLEINGYLPAEF